MPPPEPKPICPACRKGNLHESTRSCSFRPNKEEVIVELLTCKCDQCGETTTLSSQHSQNLARLAARKSQYAGVLMGEEYLTLRKRYGLTQQAAAKILGKGVATFSRYEAEESYPDNLTCLLIELAINRPEVLKGLADKAGVALPLWKERCEDSGANFTGNSGTAFDSASPRLG
jgi:putative zinc finger/helix-turn-helix YgiT family protein